MVDLVYVEKNFTASYDIPAPLAREIGRFIVTWAHFEQYVQRVIWIVLNISEADGRIALREPRVTDRLDMIRDLAEIKKKQCDFVLLASMRKRADPLATMRHLLAHGLWAKEGADWLVTVTRGAWNPHPTVQNFPPELKLKSVVPQGLPITPELVREWTAQTIELLKDLKRLGDTHTVVQHPLPRKRRVRPAQKTPKKDQGGSEPQSPHQS